MTAGPAKVGAGIGHVTVPPPGPPSSGALITGTAGSSSARASPLATLFNPPSLPILESGVVTLAKCRFAPLISRAGPGSMLVMLFWAGSVVAQAPILPKDAAVREYELGLEALKKKDFGAAIDRLNASLATGHTKPDEGFGTSRYALEWYDPWYWLGVAHMELGHDDEARRCFRLSREGGVIEKRPEYADLVERTRILDERAAASLRPTRPPPLDAPPIVPALPTPPSQPAKSDSASSRPSSGAARPGGKDFSFAPLVEAIAQARFVDAEMELERARQAVPGSAEPELLAAVLFGSRYLLEGSADRRLLERAKRCLATYRQRGGSSRAEEAWLSPPLRALLGG